MTSSFDARKGIDATFFGRVDGFHDQTQGLDREKEVTEYHYVLNI